MKRAVAVAASVLLTAGPAVAQTGADWDMRRDARAKLKVAFTAFESGLAIGARCTDGVYEVAMAGLPPAPGSVDTRILRIGFQGKPVREQTWFVASDRGTAISSLPAPLARELRKGGRMDVVVPGAGPGGANIRYVLELPASAMAIDETLGACNRTLEDPRDALLPDAPGDGSVRGRDWARTPRPAYPLTDFGAGFASLTCIGRASGEIDDCVVEAEYPPRQGFGRAALRAAEQARLEPLPDAADALVTFMTNFYVDGLQPGRRQTPPTGSRLPVPSPDG